MHSSYMFGIKEGYTQNSFSLKKSHVCGYTSLLHKVSALLKEENPTVPLSSFHIVCYICGEYVFS